MFSSPFSTTTVAMSPLLFSPSFIHPRRRTYISWTPLLSPPKSSPSKSSALTAAICFATAPFILKPKHVHYIVVILFYTELIGCNQDQPITHT
ncbi:hypothetical protein BDA96_06G042700 [Sorghum bicolor]|uniref:Uncharacterized protein n=1 Tax=Sorghum bicolor TaxID=4558 RepID=A0A921QNZ2_SORBI|nr:hypothetical protein BDA96_06G042700 [Sorghum bicolor]KAG0525288.1 hypothetical protein BDA96_06G042700 [Sorghum bicolor]